VAQLISQGIQRREAAQQKRQQARRGAEISTERATLSTGDYSVRGCEDFVALERKSLPDLVSCFTSGRERFKRELHRLQAYPKRAVVVEASWSDLVNGEYRSNLHPSSAVAAVASWTARYGVPFMFCDNGEGAELFARRFLLLAARQVIQPAETFRKALEVEKVSA